MDMPGSRRIDLATGLDTVMATGFGVNCQGSGMLDRSAGNAFVTEPTAG